MKTMSAREAKNGFGLMIDTARAAPVLIEKHGRGVVVVMSVEEYERLKEIEAGRMSASDDPASGSARPLTRFEARGQRLGHPIWERIYPHRMD